MGKFKKACRYYSVSGRHSVVSELEFKEFLSKYPRRYEIESRGRDVVYRDYSLGGAPFNQIALAGNVNSYVVLGREIPIKKYFIVMGNYRDVYNSRDDAEIKRYHALDRMKRCIRR